LRKKKLGEKNSTVKLKIFLLFAKDFEKQNIEKMKILFLHKISMIRNFIPSYKYCKSIYFQ